MENTGSALVSMNWASRSKPATMEHLAHAHRLSSVPYSSSTSTACTVLVQATVNVVINQTHIIREPSCYAWDGTHPPWLVHVPPSLFRYSKPSTLSPCKGKPRRGTSTNHWYI